MNSSEVYIVCEKNAFKEFMKPLWDLEAAPDFVEYNKSLNLYLITWEDINWDTRFQDVKAVMEVVDKFEFMLEKEAAEKEMRFRFMRVAENGVFVRGNSFSMDDKLRSVVEVKVEVQGDEEYEEIGWQELRELMGE